MLLKGIYLCDDPVPIAQFLTLSLQPRTDIEGAHQLGGECIYADPQPDS